MTGRRVRGARKAQEPKLTQAWARRGGRGRGCGARNDFSRGVGFTFFCKAAARELLLAAAGEVQLATWAATWLLFSPRRAESGRWKEASERGPERAREREESERARGAEEGREGAGGGWREEMFRGEGSRGGGGHARSRLPGSTVAAPRSLEAHGSGWGTPRGSPRPATPGRASNRGAALGGTWHPGPPVAEPGEALGWPEGRLGPCPPPLRPPRLGFSPWWRSGGGHGRGDTGRTAGPSPSRTRATAPRLPLGASGRALGGAWGWRGVRTSGHRLLAGSAAASGGKYGRLGSIFWGFSEPASRSQPCPPHLSKRDPHFSRTPPLLSSRRLRLPPLVVGCLAGCVFFLGGVIVVFLEEEVR